MTKRLPQSDYEYDAFISYRHVPKDIRIAEKLHKVLENYRTPGYLVKRGYPSRLKKVFRDRDELPTSSDLGGSIEDALLHSRFLIVICTPAALESLWVLKEVEIFSRIHGTDRILPVLAEGEPDTAFPPGLIRRLTDESGEITKIIEPLAADIRPRDNKTELELVKTESLRLLASLLDCRYDDLRQRENERRMRLIITTSASVISFLLLFGAFVLWQLKEVSAAREAALISESHTLETQSQLYAAMARKATDSGDRLLGMSVAIEALPKNMAAPEKPLVQDAKDALFYSSAMHGIQGVTAFRSGNGTTDMEDAKWCAILNNETEDILFTVGKTALRRYDLNTGRLVSEWMADDDNEILDVCPKAEKAIVAGYVDHRQARVRLIDTKQNIVLDEWIFPIGDSSLIQGYIQNTGVGFFVSAGFSPDGTLFYIAVNKAYDSDIEYRNGAGIFSSGQISLYETASGKAYYSFPECADGFTGAEFLDSEKFVAYRPDFDMETILYINTRQAFSMVDGQSLKVTPDGRHIVYWGINDLLHIYSVESGEDQDYNVVAPQISHDGSMAVFGNFVSGSKPSLYLYDVMKGEIISNLPETSVTGLNYEFSADNRYIVFDSFKIWDIQNGELIALPKPSYISEVSFCRLDDHNTHYIFTDINGVSGTILFKDPSLKETDLDAEPSYLAFSGDGFILGFYDEDKGAYSLHQWNAETESPALLESGDGLIKTIQSLGSEGFGFGITKTYFSYFDEVRLYTANGLNVIQTPLSNDFQVDRQMQYMLTNGDGGSKLWAIASGKMLKTLNPIATISRPFEGLHTVGFFPDGIHCWSTSINLEGEYEGLIIQDLQTSEIISKIPLTSSGIYHDTSAELNDDGTRLLTASMEGLQLWAIDAKLQPSLIGRLNGDYLCSSSKDIAVKNGNNVLLVDWKQGKIRTSFRIQQKCESVKARFNAEGSSLLTMGTDDGGTGDNPMTLWDCVTGKKLAVLYSEATVNTQILDFSWIKGSSQIAVSSLSNGRLHMKAFPCLQSFDETYHYALTRIGSRVFDINKDMAGIH